MVKFTQEITEEQDITIDKWDWNAVKNALDDSARKYLVSQPDFKESHRLMDGRLLISTVAVLFAGYAILYDWLHPFPESRSVLIACVVLYFIFMAVLTVYTTFIEKGCFAAAKQALAGGKTSRWKLSSKQKSRYEPNYVLEIDLSDANTGKTRHSSHDVTISKYFDEDGNLVTKTFHTDLFKWFTAISEEKKSN